MIILDSNIWIAYLNKNDSQHRKAVSLLAKIDDELLITEYIILEVVTVLAMRVDKAVADAFVDFVMNNQDIEVLYSSKDYFTSALEAFLDYREGGLSFVDISLLRLCEKFKVYTFDNELKKEIEKKIDN